MYYLDVFFWRYSIVGVATLERKEQVITLVGFCFPIFLGILFGILDKHNKYEDESRSTIRFTGCFGVRKGIRVLIHSRSHAILGYWI